MSNAYKVDTGRIIEGVKDAEEGPADDAEDVLDTLGSERFNHCLTRCKLRHVPPQYYEFT